MQSQGKNEGERECQNENEGEKESQNKSEGEQNENEREMECQDNVEVEKEEGINNNSILPTKMEYTERLKNLLKIKGKLSASMQAKMECVAKDVVRDLKNEGAACAPECEVVVPAAVISPRFVRKKEDDFL